MINKKKNQSPPFGFYLSCERVAGGVSMIVGGIISVADFTEERAEMLSHTGRITVTGRGLSMTVFENKSIELCGRIEGIGFAYGKA